MNKVLFLAGGLPHYFIPVLNKINALPNVCVEILITENKSETVGAAVHQNIKGNNFPVHFLPEQKQWYGKSFFVNLTDKLDEIKPNAIFVVWPYSLAFVFNFKLKKHIKKHNIKLVNRDIPFQVPLFNKTFEYYSKTPPIDENLSVVLSSKGIKNKIYILFLKYLRKLLYKKFDAHALYTQRGKEVIASYGVDEKKIFFIGNSIDTEPLLKINNELQFAEPILKNNSHRILHVGRLVKWKRVDLLIEAVAKLKEKFADIELLVIGNGPEKNNLMQLAETLNVSKNVVFVGGVYDDKLLAQYTKASSVYVLAGMGGLSINEAMCLAKPIIISVCDGTEDVIVKENRNGFYFKENDCDDLVAKVDILLSDKEKCEKFGQESLNIINTEMNINVLMENYKIIFKYLFN
ncbi:MAG: glycosyltransferase family 4 protein [Bacteroidota bacterium]